MQPLRASRHTKTGMILPRIDRPVHKPWFTDHGVHLGQVPSDLELIAPDAAEESVCSGGRSTGLSVGRMPRCCSSGSARIAAYTAAVIHG